ncbi:MAG: SDR family NAD(P)-dependent oxidoreductase [Thermoleophilia bacterium]
MDLDGAHVLVTGASRGIGEAFARDFAAAGAKVTCVARDAAAIGAIAGEIGGTAVAADLLDREALRGLIARVEEEAGPVDVLVNNAGIDLTGAFTDLGADDLERLVALDLLAVMELTRQALPGMVERGRGHIVNVASLAGVAVFPGLVAYSACKAEVTHFTAGLRADLRGLPIGTTVVEVGLVPTDMKDSLIAYEPTAASFRRFNRLGLLRDTTPERLSRATVEAVQRDRRHVRLPRRATTFAMLTEAPRRITEMTLSGVRHR